MNSIEIAESVFTDQEKWISYLELNKFTEGLKRKWLAVGSRNIIQKWNSLEEKTWRVSYWDGDVDLKWTMFDADCNAFPISIGYGWEYEFHLLISEGFRFDLSVVDRALDSSFIKTYFPENGRRGHGSLRRGPRPYFSIGETESNEPLEFAWLSGNESEGTGLKGFSDQVIEKIRNLVSEPEFENGLRTLNEAVRSEALITVD